MNFWWEKLKNYKKTGFFTIVISGFFWFFVVVFLWWVFYVPTLLRVGGKAKCIGKIHWHKIQKSLRLNLYRYCLMCPELGTLQNLFPSYHKCIFFPSLRIFNKIQESFLLYRGGEPGQFGPGSLRLRLLPKKGRLFPAPAPAPAPTIIFVNIY